MTHRICPECKNVMIEEKHNGIHIDKCNFCHGVFLDFGEIKNIIENVEFQKTFDKVEKGDFKKDNIGKDIICAKCSKIMDEREYIYGSGNHINFCTNCGSVYLNKGELKQVQDFEISRISSKEGRELLNKMGLQGLEISKNQKNTISSHKYNNKPIYGVLSSSPGALYGLLNKIFK